MPLHFGEHITIDGYGGNVKLLDDKEVVTSCLSEICTLMHMHPLGNGKPTVVQAPDNHFKDPGGWSGFLIIAESHIALHTFPKRRFLSADVYTCKNGLNADFVVEFFKKKFKLEEVEHHFIKRGIKYPDHNIA